VKVLTDGRHIDQFIPRDLRGMFYRNPHPENKYRVVDGYDPYGFSTDGLVLYLPLWALKGSTFKSVDAYKHTCTVTNTTWQPDGRLFGGDGFIETGKTIQQLGITNAITMMAWVKSSAVADYRFFLASNDAAGNKRCDLYTESNTWKATIQATGLSTIVGAATDTDWTLVCLTYDGTTTSLYVNTGDAVTSAVASGNISTTGNLTIGRAGDYTNAAYIWKGTIGEVWGYNRALSAGEVLHNYKSTAFRYQ